MQAVDLDCQFPVVAERLWQTLLLDHEYLRELHSHLRVHVDILDEQVRGSGPTLTLDRRSTLRPQRQLPAPLARLVHGNSTMQEKAIYSARDRRFDVELEVPVLGSRVELRHVYTWQDDGVGGVHVFWHGQCQARVPLLAKRLESFLLGELTESIRTAAMFAQTWLQATSETLRSECAG